MSTETKRPFFSVVVSTLNRSGFVQRCVQSCLEQSFPDFEVIVVDDGSTDSTSESLRVRWPALTVVTHHESRGISASRASGVNAARGSWIVVLDSDWTLLPGALARLYEIVGTADPDVGVIRGRMLWDGVEVRPTEFATGRFGYADRVRFAAETDGLDLSTCIRADVLEQSPYPDHRADSLLFEFNVARVTTSLFVKDVFVAEYTDAANSWLRSTDARTVVPQMLAAAPDLLHETVALIGEHGAQIQESGPQLWPILLKSAATQSFLCGYRNRGLGYCLRALRAGDRSLGLPLTALLGLIGPRAVAFGALGLRRLRRVRSQAAEFRQRRILGLFRRNLVVEPQ